MKFGIHGVINKIIVAVFVVIGAANCTIGQTRTNLQIMNGLVDSVASGITRSLLPGEKGFYLKYDAGKDFEIFRNQLTSDFRNSGLKVYSLANEETPVTVSVVIDNAKVEYGDMSRSGFLGSFYVPRLINLSGSYGIYRDSAEAKNFNYTFKDTVRVDSIKQIENNSYSFTKGDVPPEPFFGDLLEPIVAIGTAAVAVILFFTVRSK